MGDQAFPAHFQTKAQLIERRLIFEAEVSVIWQSFLHRGGRIGDAVRYYQSEQINDKTMCKFLSSTVETSFNQEYQVRLYMCVDGTMWY